MSNENFPGDIEPPIDDNFTNMVFALRADTESGDACLAWTRNKIGSPPKQTYEVHRVKQELIESGMSPLKADSLANEAHQFIYQEDEEVA